jgi:hypothetical protein
MKKKMLGIIAFAAIAAVAGWNYNQNMNNVNLSDLALENVEALANGEITTPTECPGGTVLCAWIIAGESVTYYKL